LEQCEWKIESQPVEYPAALALMEQRVAEIRAGTAPELIWLLEHPPLYTAGTSANVQDLLAPRFPVYETGRGGQYTYHGPGQRVAYVMLDLQKRMNGGPDLRRFVWLLEEWIIRTLAHFDVTGCRREARVGIWVSSFLNGAVTAPNPTAAAASHLLGESGQSLREDKVAALGIRVKKWVSLHGIAINVNPDLGHFSGIVPCGIREHGVTSLHALGKTVGVAELDKALRREFSRLEWS